MTVLQKADFTCPVCTRQFQSEAVVSTNSFGGKRTDFHERAAGAQPHPYFIHVCPECGFAGKKYMYEREIDLWSVGEKVKSELSPRMQTGITLNGSEKYEHAAKCAEWNGENLHEIGNLWLKAAWCCVDEGDIEAERFFRIKAANKLADALNVEGEIVDEEKPIIDYLVGELWRRIGNVKLSDWWFDQATNSAQEFLPKLQWVIDAAKQQKEYPREWFG